MQNNDYIPEQSSNISTDKPPQYGYTHVDMEYIINNPEEYIIPECLPACRALWEKNIETFMVSNYDNPDSYYISIMPYTLSEENIKIFEEKFESNPENYVFSTYNHSYNIKINRNRDEKNEKEASEKLLSLTEVFVLQDTKRFQNADEFLKDYKSQGGEAYINQYAEICHKENPLLSNVTLNEALKETGKTNLYIPEENRIYKSELFKNWHMRYLKRNGGDGGI